MELATNDSHWGYIGYQHETTDLDQQKEGDTKEGFMIAHNDSNSPRMNQWPSMMTLSDGTTTESEWAWSVQEYMDRLSLLSIELAQLAALSLNLSADYFEAPGIRDHSQELLYFLHYPPQQSDPNLDLFGAGSHTDYQVFAHSQFPIDCSLFRFLDFVVCGMCSCSPYC